MDDASRRRQDCRRPSLQSAIPEAKPAAPAANLSGRWDVDIEFFSSKSRHTLTLEQENNLLQGSHKGDFSVRDVVGTIESDQVKLRSTENVPGDSITFTFVGTLSGGNMAGKVYMGEYLNANFTAKRHVYPANSRPVLVPGGPPLAN